jgi:extracellular elastinolytic metalloproteinase
MRAVFTTLVCTVLSLSFGWSQKQTPLDIALRYVEQQQEEWGLQPTDIVDMVVSDQYSSKHNGVTHIFFKQRHASFEVYNAINGVHITQDGEVGYATNRFISGLKDRVNTTVATITAQQAIERAASHFGLPAGLPLRLIEKKSDHEYIFEGGTLSNTDITVKLSYQPLDDGNVHLAWDLAMDLPTSPDYWSVRVDATSGEILHQHNYTVYCSHPGGLQHVHGAECGLDEAPAFTPVEEALTTVTDGATYNVYPVPVESPNFGDRELVAEPSDPEASPYGWHDTNGQDGPEFTITRGNNVHAFLDRDDNFSPDNDEPNGGGDLYFDFPIDLTQEPSSFSDAATVQLFYMNNVMHDLAYHYGMDEAAGNFQQNNYSGEGNDGDYVFALAQAKADIDPASTMDQVVNNAFFSTPPDGNNGLMSMFEWDRSSSELFRILSPDPLAGSFEVSTATFGAIIGSEPIDGIVAQAFDGSNQPNLVCDPVINPEDIDGKIALIDRGDCWFEQKVLNAQNGGAIAVIICNFEEALVGMGGVPEVDDPTIPAVMLRNGDCQQIKAAIAQGTDVEVRFQFEDADTGPSRLDGTIDNGIIAHEYGHGISNRLTAGPSAAGCLGNDEQMGEGWSDFFTLITSVKPEDVAETPRGIASYATSANPNGGGLRRRPYSTDFSVNNQTYRDVVNTGGPGRARMVLLRTPPSWRSMGCSAMGYVLGICRCVWF